MAIDKIFLLHHTHLGFGHTAERYRVMPELIEMVANSLDLAVQFVSRPEPGNALRGVQPGSCGTIQRNGASRCVCV
jgi:hypothetical protein